MAHRIGSCIALVSLVSLVACADDDGAAGTPDAGAVHADSGSRPDGNVQADSASAQPPECEDGDDCGGPGTSEIDASGTVDAAHTPDAGGHSPVDAALPPVDGGHDPVDGGATDDGGLTPTDGGATTSSAPTSNEYVDFPSFLADADALTTITFEELGVGERVLAGDEYGSLGLSIQQRDGHPMRVIAVGSGFAFPDNANSPTRVLSSSIGSGGTFVEVSDAFDLVFARPVRSAGLWIGNIEPGSTEVQFLDVGGNVLAREVLTGSQPSLVGTAGGDNRIFAGAVSASLIQRIRIVEPAGDSDGITLDDIQFSTDAVSSPGVVELFDHAQFVSAADPLTVFDFENVPGPGDGAVTGMTFSMEGLVVVNRSGEPVNSVQTGAGFAFLQNASSGTHVISSSIASDGSYRDTADDLEFVFRQPVPAAGLWVGNIEPGTTTIEFLDAADNVVASELIGAGHAGIIGAPGGDNRVFYGVLSDIPIARIRAVEPNGDSDGVTFDDVQFSQTGTVVDRISLLTWNVWQWPAAGGASVAEREARLMREVQRRAPDLISFQEVLGPGVDPATAGATGATGAAVALADLGYHVVHQQDLAATLGCWTATSPLTVGVLIASRWPFEPDSPACLDLKVPGTEGFPYAALFARVQFPDPMGTLVIGNPKPAWLPGDGMRREEQASLFMGFVEAHYAGEPIVLAGDFDDVYTSCSLMHVTDGRAGCLYPTGHGFRDAWREAGDGPLEAGLTFASDNAMAAPVIRDYSLGERRIDYLFVRWPLDAASLSPVHWNATRVLIDDPGNPISGHWAVGAQLRRVGP